MAKPLIYTGNKQEALPSGTKTELYYWDNTVGVSPGTQQQAKDPLKANADPSLATSSDVKMVTNPKAT